MRAHRTVARLVATGAMLVVGAGAALLSPGVASAAPEGYGHGAGGAGGVAGGAYPAPKPTLTVNAASVTTGRAVRISGSGFRKGEPVAIVVRYRITLRSAAFPPAWGQGGIARANDQGKVMSRVSLNYPGYATITVKGLKSHKTASVTVRVLAWRNPWAWGGFGGFFQQGGFAASSSSGKYSMASMRLAANTAGNTVDDQSTGDGAAGAQLLAGLLGVVGLFGSAVFALRRRRA
jgi:hypothetical protein